MKILLLAITLLVTITASAQLPTYVPTANLVTYYAFDNVDSTNDLSGNGNNGIIYGVSPTLTSDKCFNPNSAYNINLTGMGVIRCAVDTTNFHQFNNGQTISFWVHIPMPVPVDGIEHYMLKYGKATISLHNSNILYKNGYDSISVDPFSHPTIWINYTVTIKDTITVYLNGVPTVRVPATIPTDSIGTYTDGNLYIGSYLTNTDTSNVFWGGVDNFAIYNRVISDSEALVLYYNCPSILDVSNVTSMRNKIYPIPANNNLTIENDNNTTYNIIDATGKVIKTLKTGTTDISDIPNGMYIITDGVIMTKLIINH